MNSKISETINIHTDNKYYTQIIKNKKKTAAKVCSISSERINQNEIKIITIIKNKMKKLNICKGHMALFYKLPCIIINDYLCRLKFQLNNK